MHDRVPPPTDPADGARPPSRPTRRELPPQPHLVGAEPDAPGADDEHDTGEETLAGAVVAEEPADGRSEAVPEAPEEAIASRSTAEEARDLLALRRAKAGDDAAFAGLIRDNEPGVRAFAHALIGPDELDRVLADSFLKAYRGLALAPDRDPRLWLLRLAGTACFDAERRRTRPSRRRAAPGAEPDRAEPTPPTIPVDLPDEQRVAVALVDATGLTVREAARVTDRIPERLRDDLASGRSALAADGVHAGPPEGALPEPGPDFWNHLARDLLVARETPATRLDAATDVATPARPRPASRADGAPARRVEARNRRPGTGPVSNRSAEAVQAAREAHEASARRAAEQRRAVGPAPGATPNTPPGPSPRAAQAARGMARRVEQSTVRVVPWRRIGLGALAALLLVTAVVATVTIAHKATTRDVQLGLTTDKVMNRLDDALSDDQSVRGTVQITSSGRSGEPVSGTYRFLHLADGSYRLTALDGHWDEAYDASRATFGLRTGARSVAASGVSPGPPDPAGVNDTALGDPLATTLRLLHKGRNRTVDTRVLQPQDLASGGATSTAAPSSAPTTHASAGGSARPTTTVAGTPVWQIAAGLADASPRDRRTVPGVGTLAAAPGGDRVRVVIDQPLMLPLQVTVLRHDLPVLVLRFGDLAINDPVQATDLHVGAAPRTAPLSPAVDLGFRPTSLSGAATAVGYQPSTPSYLPDGYSLTNVAARRRAPAGAPSTAAGANPPDVDVLVLTYRRGSLSLTITLRRTGAHPERWHDPFAPAESSGASGAPTRTDPHSVSIGSGAFTGARARSGTAPVPHVWAVRDDFVLTVAGDVSLAQLRTVAASMH